jgi:tetratricopeptide (TPR) repeat protein
MRSDRRYRAGRGSRAIGPPTSAAYHPPPNGDRRGATVSRNEAAPGGIVRRGAVDRITSPGKGGRALGPDHVDLLLWLHLVLRCQFATGPHEAAQATFARCQTIASSQPEPPFSFAGPLLALADFCDEIGEYESALSLYKRVFKMCEGFESPSYRRQDVDGVNACFAQALNGMGIASFRLGDLAQSEQCLEKSLEFFEAAYGSEASKTLKARSNLELVRTKP